MGSAAVDPGRSWDNRARAESFGVVAAAYDQVRPRYPEDVVGQVALGRPPSPASAGGPVRVLDIGTGTGILARQLQAAGAEVTGTDIDEGMAAVARAQGLEVHVAQFETLTLPALLEGRPFDRITAGQAWHWIEPTAGLAAVTRLLASTGQLWLLWNFGRPSTTLRAAIDDVYEQTPQISAHAVVRGGGFAAADLAADLIRRTPGMTVEVFDTAWERTYARDEWLQLVSTQSDHALLPRPVREHLLERLGAVIDEHGGAVPVNYTTRAVVAHGFGSDAAGPGPV